MRLEYLPTFTNKLNLNCRLNLPVPLDPMGLEFRNVSISHINHPSLSSLATWKHNKACVPTLGISRQDLEDTSGRPRLEESVEILLIPLDLKWFSTFYRGKSPSNHHLDPFGKLILVLLQARICHAKFPLVASLQGWALMQFPSRRGSRMGGPNHSKGSFGP